MYSIRNRLLQMVDNVLHKLRLGVDCSGLRYVTQLSRVLRPVLSLKEEEKFSLSFFFCFEVRLAIRRDVTPFR